MRKIRNEPVGHIIMITKMKESVVEVRLSALLSLGIRLFVSKIFLIVCMCAPCHHEYIIS
jgi:hypothetical protein